MLPPDQLAGVLESLNASTFRDRLYRASQLVHLKTLTSTQGAWAGHNRYTRPGLSQALYVADGPDQAMLEATRQLLSLFATQPIPGYVIFPVIADLQRVLDLTDTRHYAALGTSLSELTGDWRAERGQNLPVATQLLGEAAFNAGFQAIRYPSAPNPRRFNLVLFTERLESHQLQFELDEPVREFMAWHAQHSG